MQEQIVDNGFKEIFLHKLWDLGRWQMGLSYMACGQWATKLSCVPWELLKKPHCTAHIPTHCGVRICEDCGIRAAKKYFKEYYPILEKQEHLKLITLTSSLLPTKENFIRLRENFKVAYPKIAKRWGLLGCLYALEIGGSGAKLHIHMLVISPNYIPQSWLTKAWKEASGDFFVVDIRQVRSPKIGLQYITKYLVKPVGNMEAVFKQDVHSAAQFLAGICNGLYHRRRLGTRGIVYRRKSGRKSWRWVCKAHRRQWMYLGVTEGASLDTSGLSFVELSRMEEVKDVFRERLRSWTECLLENKPTTTSSLEELPQRPPMSLEEARIECARMDSAMKKLEAEVVSRG